MGIENIVAFVITSFIFIITPGIDTAFVLNKTISQGKKSGIYATVGINTGVLVHTFCAALGLSLLIAKSVYVFQCIKYAGATYLFFQGIRLLFNKKSLGDRTVYQHEQSTKNDFWSGLLTNTLNPKVALFFLSFFPQFINPQELNNPLPFLILGITYAFIGMIWYLTLTLFASVFAEKIIQNPKAGIWLNQLSGVAFLLMGLKILWSND
ncbi:LysE family translocator [Flammeovirga agarivorans]|uniref:LysE family translocator n=1 Tax=Flammeovirga agarivorans TaxID=2726742 RepID=A0A7X8SP13_9BACT|nr:LysE family translocator [Flammeovirga agarivorans]NLR93763.1 LysE family translocator [Flammeovirga agarivorans]